MNTKDIIKDLKILGDLFDFSNFDKTHELFSNKNKKVIGKTKLETPKTLIVDEFVALNRKMYSFKCRYDSKNKLKGISKSQSKHIQFKEYKKRLTGKKF